VPDGHRRQAFENDVSKSVRTSLPGIVVSPVSWDESMAEETDSEGSDYTPKPRPKPGDEIDITPMIDVTFQLLIFFMVTSTMQGTPDLDIPQSVSGGSIEVARVINLMVRAPADTNSDPELELEGTIVTLDELRVQISEEASARPRGIDLMIMGDKGVPNGFTGEIETMLSEIPGVTYHFAVQDRRQK
jgi:biopolymer transport protein ExbD